MLKTSDLIQERKQTHGPWKTQATIAQTLKAILRNGVVMRNTAGQDKISPEQLEALEMILVKVSRIVCGNASEPDHWADIQGYAELGKAGDHPDAK